MSTLRWSTWDEHDAARDRGRRGGVRPVVVGPYERLLGPEPGERPWYVNDHTFFRDPVGTWHLVGITHDEPFAPFDETEFVHATAPDLHGPWQRHAPALVADPDHGEHHLWAPHVIDHDGLLWMYYCAGGDSKDRYRIHLATSSDGWTWTRHPGNPMVVDGFEARDPMVRRVDDRWVMYYTATSDPAGGAHVVAAVESDDLVHWRGRHEVYRDRSEGTGAGPTESPFVVEVDGTWLLFIGPDHDGLVGSKERTGRYDLTYYRRTRVLASDDPMHFEADDEVAVIESHAAEVVVDTDGTLWVSHCGWGQGGVHLAPLRWADDGDDGR
ncbi:MAG: hypothetical protein U0Q03_11470 [Acidimicrobiales bacterium]